MLKKLIFSFALVGILLGSFKGYTVYAQDDSGSEVTTETTTEATTGATTESTQTTPSTKDPNSSETTSEVVASNDNKYKVKISIALAKAGWYNDSAMVNVKVEKIYGDSKFKINTIEAKIGSTGSWVDITDDKAIEITENCTVYVKVTDMNGQEYEKNRFIKCFDTVPPTLNAAVSEGLLTVLTYDTESGVKNIYINEYSFDPDENGVVSVRLQKFDSTYQYFYIYAIDNAGNSSTVYTVNNPYYKDKTTEEGSSEENTEDPADSLPDNGSATVTNPSTGAVTSVTDEAGKDISKTVNKKQFYTIVTRDGQQYFLVIDMSASYTDDGVDVTHGNGTVYFLTSVSNDNLLNFVNSGEQTLPQNSVAQGNNIDKDTVTPDMDESTTEESTEDANADADKKKESKGLGIWLYVIIFGVMAIVIVGYKALSGKKGKPEANDDEMYGLSDEDDLEETDYDPDQDE